MNSGKLFLKVYRTQKKKPASAFQSNSRFAKRKRQLTFAHLGKRIGARILREVFLERYPILKFLLQQIHLVEEKDQVDLEEQLVSAYLAPQEHRVFNTIHFRVLLQPLVKGGDRGEEKDCVH